MNGAERGAECFGRPCRDVQWVFVAEDCRIVRSQSVEETRAWGRRIGAALRGGEVLALIGPLGAGKTQLAKGIVAGAGAGSPEQVTSPTFVLMNEYAGAVRIHHIDVYRLRSPDELADIGFEEMFRMGGVVLLEWADRVPSILPDEKLTIEIAVEEPMTRSLHFSAVGTQAIDLLNRAGVFAPAG